MSSLWGKWLRVTSRMETGETVALFRIFVGLCLLGTLASVINADLVDMMWVDRTYGGYRKLGHGPWLINFLGGPRADVVWAVCMTAIAASVLMIFGLGGRVTALVANQTYFALTGLNGHAGGSYEPLLVNALWLLVLAGGDVTWSVRARVRTGRWSSGESVMAWPRYLIMIQLLVVYISTATQKVGSGWTPVGEFNALYYIMMDLQWARWELPWMGRLYPMLQVTTAITWLWELSWLIMPLLLWYSVTPERPGRLRALVNRFDVRKVYLLCGAALHAGIGIFMEVTTFGWVMMTFYIGLFRPHEVRSLFEHLGSFVGRLRKTPG